MPRARLTIDLPEETWIGDVSTEFPEATFRVLAAIPNEEVGFALVELTADDSDPVLCRMRDHEGLCSVEVLHRSSRVIVQIETTTPLVLFSEQASGVPIEPPIVIEDGVATVDILVSHDRLSELGEQLERFGLGYTLQAVYDAGERETLLSERQLEVLKAAVEGGYYDVPRRCSLTELAEEVGIAKSTCSETLHRIESTIVTRFLEETDDPGVSVSHPSGREPK